LVLYKLLLMVPTAGGPDLPIGMWLSALVFGFLSVVVGTGYLISPRFVKWTLTNDRTGRRWVNLLGYERAAIAMRYVFSILLIGFGASALYIALVSN
jgi:hypothetical protein